MSTAADEAGEAARERLRHEAERVEDAAAAVAAAGADEEREAALTEALHAAEALAAALPPVLDEVED